MYRTLVATSAPKEMTGADNQWNHVPLKRKRKFITDNIRRGHLTVSTVCRRNVFVTAIATWDTGGNSVMLRAVTPYWKYLVKACCVTLITTRETPVGRDEHYAPTHHLHQMSRKVLRMKGLHTQEHTFFYRSAPCRANVRFNFATVARCVEKSPTLLASVLRNLQNCDRMQ